MKCVAMGIAAVTAVMAIMVASCGKQDGGETPASAPVASAAAPAPAVAAPAPAAAATPAVTIQPMHSEGSLIHYPRVSGLADAAVQAKVNAIVAAREKQAAEDREGCFDLVRDAGETPTDANFSVKIDVRYVSARYVSLEIRRSYSCAGPYPNDDVPEPLTIDLTAGTEVVWRKIFKLDPAPTESGGDLPDHVVRAYKVRYAKEGGRDVPECKDVIQQGVSTLFVRLDARRGVVMQPELPHVAAACADEIAFPVDEIAPQIADADFLTDLRATVQPHR